MNIDTKFLTPFQKKALVDGAKAGNEPEEREIYNEFDRLESRIRQLELALSLAITQANSSRYQENHYFN